MNLIKNLRGAFGERDAAVVQEGPPRILLFGDSHVHAIREAMRHRAHAGVECKIEARRLLKRKKRADEPDEPVPEDEVRAPWFARIKAPGRSRRDDPQDAPSTEQTMGDTTLDDFLLIARSLRPRARVFSPHACQGA